MQVLGSTEKASSITTSLHWITYPTQQVDAEVAETGDPEEGGIFPLFSVTFYFLFPCKISLHDVSNQVNGWEWLNTKCLLENPMNMTRSGWTILRHVEFACFLKGKRLLNGFLIHSIDGLKGVLMKRASLSRFGRGKTGFSWGLALILICALFFVSSQSSALAADASEEGRINVHAGTSMYKVPYFRNYPLNIRNEDIYRVVIAVHGAGDSNSKAEQQYDRMKASACMIYDPAPDPHWRDRTAADPDCELNSTLIMAPHFPQTNANLAHYGLDRSTGLIWRSSQWKFGGPSENAGGLSSYDVMDRVIEYVATGGNFPNVEKIVIAGHSAGGQFVNRYAAATRIGETISGSGVQMRYIVANPSSYLYFTDERVFPGTMNAFATPVPAFHDLCPDPYCCPDDPGPCPITYNDYIYGLGDGLNDYWQAVIDDIGIEGVKLRYRNKSVAYLLGRLDTDSCDPWLDRSCGALLEGRNRLERGLVYYNYIGHALGDSVYDHHYLYTIENAGHSSSAAWKSNVGRHRIFDGALLPEYPEILSPRGIEGSPDHTYKWYAIPGAGNYRIQVTDTSGGGGSFTREVTPAEAGCPHGGLCSKTIPSEVNEGTWTVSARLLSAWFDSDPAAFEVRAPDASTLRAPIGAEADHTPTFEWDASDGATRYQLVVFNNRGGINYIHSYSPLDASCDCSEGGRLTCSVTPSTILNNGDHWWMLRPTNLQGGNAWSTPSQFTVETPNSLPNDTYRIKVRSSGRGLELDNRTNTNAQLRKCRKSNRQEWEITTAGMYSTIQRRGKCLEADDSAGSDTTNGGNVQVADCISSSSANDHQEWRIERAQDGFYTLTVRSSGKCMDADNYANRDMRDCGNVQIWDCKDPLTRNTDNQEWRLERVGKEFRHPTNEVSFPLPDIRANDSHRSVEVSRSGSLTVSIALDNHNTIGPDADYWLFQQSSAGFLFLTPSGWSSTPAPILQAALVSFPPPVLDLPMPLGGVPTGTYWLYFAVDTNQDGILSLNQLYLDGVRVVVTP